MDIPNYDPSEIEPKWQTVWEEKKVFVPNVKTAKKPHYNLMMFPYPSAEGMHVGNMYPYTAGDIHGRFKKMQGYDVFEPMGLDGFGIHSENYALKIGRKPKDHARLTEENFYRQLRMVGAMFDWTRTVETYNPNYYRWTQWLFVKMFKAGLAYRAKALVNWCPKDKTVLSDEQVIDGKCERCGTEVEKRELEQWFFRITKYADRLFDNLPNLDWSEKVKTTQANWIGKKDGAKIRFKVQGLELKDKEVEVFTTRPDTIFGATFVAVSPMHELAKFAAEQKSEVKDYIDQVKSIATTEKSSSDKDKTGVNTGFFAVNPVNGKEIPVWVADYVLPGTGTGALMGVPANDERDLEFAKKYNLAVVEVIDGEGLLVNSGEYSGHEYLVAAKEIVADLAKKGLAENFTTYHLRDWSISRQRYWGPPIPMIFCQKCATEGKGERKEMPGWYSVAEKELPVVLPDIDDYQPEGNGKGPLAKHPEFYETTCPGCGGQAERETDVSDSFLDSSWYELRYPSVGLPGTVKNGEELPWDQEVLEKWLPVDMYTGGAEHAVLHLMYFRFVVMAMHDLGYVSFDEPTKSFFAHGLIIKDGAKMSKSKGNVINPDEYIRKYGSDALRLYLMFMGPVSEGGDFRDSGMQGMRKWVERVWRFVLDQSAALSNDGVQSGKTELLLNRLVKKATEDYETRRYNTVIAGMMEFVNEVHSQNLSLSLDQLRIFLRLLAPIAPHVTEELWQKLHSEQFHQPSDKNEDDLVNLAVGVTKSTGKSAKADETEDPTVVSDRKGDDGFVSLHQQSWPEVSDVDESKELQTIAISINGKTRGTLEVSSQDEGVLGEKGIVSKAQTVDSVSKYLVGKTIKNTIYVRGKIVNFVTD